MEQEFAQIRADLKMIVASGIAKVNQSLILYEP